MSSSKAIGGYFELETGEPQGGFLHDGAVLLHSGRACFEYIIKAAAAPRVWLPRYICGVMLEPLERNGVAVAWYDVSRELTLEDEPELAAGDLLVYANYFGIMDGECRRLAEKYGGQLVLDCSQALFFNPPAGIHTFYSPRKFCGVPDGGCLYSPLSLNADIPVADSSDRMAHLTKRLEHGPQAGYAGYTAAEAELSAVPMMRMSEQTRQLLARVDFTAAAAKRAENYAYLHSRLGAANVMPVPATASGPLCYPYQASQPDLRQRLIKAEIFVPQYWPDVLERCEPGSVAHQLAQQIIPLPVDQRYGKHEMDRILEVIHG